MKAWSSVQRFLSSPAFHAATEAAIEAVPQVEAEAAAGLIPHGGKKARAAELIAGKLRESGTLPASWIVQVAIEVALDHLGHFSGKPDQSPAPPAEKPTEAEPTPAGEPAK